MYQDTLMDIKDAKIANMLACASLLLSDITRRPGEWYSTQSTGSELKSTSTCNKILDAKFFKDVLIKVLRPSGPDSLPGGSWWQSGLGTHIGDTWTTFIQPELAGSTWPWMWWWWSNLEVKRTYSLPPHPVGGGCTIPPSSLAELVKRYFRYYSRLLQCTVYKVSCQLIPPYKFLMSDYVVNPINEILSVGIYLPKKAWDF